MDSTNEKPEYILNVNDFARYIMYKYDQKYQKDISPIKLQKSLYFCYAIWGGFVLKSKGTEEEIKESPYLFNSCFQAWDYGPVIPTIHRGYKAGKIKKYEKIDEDSFFKHDDFLKENINSLLDDIFEVSDFKLVNISHEDNSWKEHYKADDKKHNGAIDGFEIIKEYSCKQ